MGAFAVPAMIGLNIAGGALSASSTLAGGKAAAQMGLLKQQAAYQQAVGLEQNAKESRAVAQRQAFEKRREGDLLESKLIARAAASGGGADDATVLALGDQIEGRSELSALTEMFKGESRARGLEDQAAATRYEGDLALREGAMKRKASKWAAIGTLIDTAGSAFKTYKTYG